MYDWTRRRNQEMSQKDGYELVHIVETKEYGTFAGNRVSIGTTISEAIRHDGKIFSKAVIKEFSTDLVRNYTPTKSTKETHKKKIDKAVKGLSNIIQDSSTMVDSNGSDS